MDHSGMDMGATTTSIVMNMATTATAGAAAATTSAARMSMGGGSCKISMLWNWTVIDACFIARSWRITSRGMFAGSCIGVVLLVMSLELLRRGSKEYDRYLLRQHQRSQAALGYSSAPACQPSTSGKGTDAEVSSANGSGPATPFAVAAPFRPNVFQQALRATFHMTQFTIAYFVMLLAMYYNGYIIISIIIGAWLGAFVFSWETLSPSGPKEDSTYCCG